LGDIELIESQLDGEYRKKMNRKIKRRIEK
jgi:hypothetical protein